MMEQLFEMLDKKAKELQKENGHSFIENLGLALEDVYTNERDTLEQSTLAERRKAFQFAYLSLMKEELIQPNHQMTPDSIGYLVSYIISMYIGDQKEVSILDITSGTGHLSATINEQNKEVTLEQHLVEVDPVLSRLSVHLANFLEIPFDVYPQDAIMPLSLPTVDIVTGDLPIGYYPNDARSHEMKLGFESGHSFSHHLLIEQAIAALKPGGHAFLIVPSNLFEFEDVSKLQSFIASETVMNAFLNFPEGLFKTEHTRKSLLILQKKGEVQPPVEVLLANIPDFKDQQKMQQFLSEFRQWFVENCSKK